MNILSAICFIFIISASSAKDCPNKKSNSKLFCYYSKLTDVDSCKCSHVILPANSDVKSIDRLREHVNGIKILITVNEFNQGLVNILKTSKVDGIEIDLKKLDSKNDINDFISTVRSKLGADLYIVLSVPAKGEYLAKYYDFKTLSKNADVFILQTAFLGASKNVTFHPSRLSGLWDMQNTDSVVDLVSGLGAPLSKLVITSPVQAYKFKLQDEDHTAPGSPALEVESITRDELCSTMADKSGNWTLERDQDQAGPYIFSKDQWIAFDDAMSIDIKAKYARVRGLAGIAIKDLSQDGGVKCESSILEAAYNGLSRQARAPRGAVLHSLEREILGSSARPLDTIQVSPYRISRVIDTEGNVHVVRQDTRTEFECSRQGYFVHPRSCGRFYRCVKFDQLSDEFSVFEFDCPAGLAFDSRVEVCVWPGSLPHASACSGSSEIAPVPRERFVCPNEPGYYADPENCRWFFACLDHGKSPLSAYEFRCPFGLVYDESRLLCEWSWLVPKCGSGLAIGSEVVYGGSGLVALDQYNGLGVLGATRLGGLHGPIQQSVPQVFSNVGTIGLTSAAQGVNLIENNKLAHGNTGYSDVQYSAGNGLGAGQTQGTYYGNYGAGNYGLSYGAVQSLQNAGLVKAGLGYNSANGGNLNYVQYAANGGGYAANAGPNVGSGFTYSNGQNSLLNYGYQNNAYGAKSAQGFEHYHGTDANKVNLNSGVGYVTTDTGNYHGNSNSQENYVVNGISNLNYDLGSSGAGAVGSGENLAIGVGAYQGSGYGAKSTQSFTQFQNSNSAKVDFNSGLAYAAGDAEYTGNYQGVNNAAVFGAKVGEIYAQNAHVVNGLAYDQNAAALGAAYGAKSQQSITQYHGQGQAVLTAQNQAGGAYDTSKSTVEYHGNTGSRYETGTAGNINIVGGGYSAVGVSNVGVDITSNGEDTHTVTHVTPSPISVTTVTSVPVPALKVATGFHRYRGGVVANVPELQYKVQRQPVSNVLYQGNLNANVGASGANSSTSFVNFVTSTPATVSVNGGYEYPKPAVEFVEEPVRTTIYQKPTVFVSTTQAPVIVQKVNLQHAVDTTYNVHNKEAASFAGYDYSESPIQLSRPAGGSFSYQNIDTVHQEQGYIYPKPSITFEEIPRKTVSYSTPSTIKPVTFVQQVQPVVEVQQVVQTVVKQQPPVTYSNFQGYDYPKPSVVFEEKPQIQVTSYNVPSSTVRPVIVQQPQIYVSSTPATIVKQKVVQPAVISSFQGYDYPKPSIVFEEKPQIQVTSYNVPSSTVRPVIVQQPQIYVSSTPATIVKQNVVQPAVVSSFHISSQPQVHVQQQAAVEYNEGYHYNKPVVTFEEGPRVTYKQPAISTYTYQTPVQVKPAVSTYNYKNVLLQQNVEQGYSYPKPAIPFEETTRLRTPAVVSSYSYTSTAKPAVLIQKQEPVFVQKQPAVVSSYSYTAPSTVRPAVEFTGYDYPKPVVPFVEQPVVTSYENRQPVEEVPFVAKKAYVTGGQSSSYQFNQQYNTAGAVQVEQKPVVVESYHAPKYEIKQQYSNVDSGYVYEQPAIKFEERPIVVSTTPKYEIKQQYSNVDSGYVYEQPAIKFEERPIVVSTTPKYEIKQQYSNVDSGYVYEQPAIKFEERPIVVSTTPKYEIKQQYSNVDSGYVYEQPAIRFEERPIVVSTTPKYEIKQQYSNVDSGYVYEQPAIRFEERPIVVSTTPKYEIKQQYSNVDSGYVYEQPAIKFEERPIVVSTTPKYEIKQQYSNVDSGYVYEQPAIKFEERPIVVSTTPKYEIKQQYSNIDSGYVYEKPSIKFDERPVVVENYQAPLVKVNYAQSVDVSNSNYENYNTAKVVSSTSTPIVDYSYVQSTPRPTFATVLKKIVSAKIQPVTERQQFYIYDRSSSTQKPFIKYAAPISTYETVTSSRPIAKYSFSSLDDQYSYVSTPGPLPTEKVVVEEYVAPIEVTTPRREYLPVRKNRVKVVTSTVAPTEAYVVSTPTREYLPVRSKVRLTSTTPATPSRDYLPAEEEIVISTRRPVKVVKVVRPKTIVKVNDFHPLLAAKLGAQCTCGSNTVKLRKNKKPLRIVVEEGDDNDDDDGYIVEQNSEGGNIVENYEYEPKKIVDITQTPEIYIKSTTNEIEPAPTPLYTVRRRVRVRPVTSTTISYDYPVTEAVEVFLKKSSSSDEPSDKEIVKAVRTGLKLVKQAAKEGAKEGTHEVLSGKDFDRYGPGGVRSRNERLQGTIDCQRAGLFRHPTQCNKFYACRWDCTKNRYTLHVFNCPVHLTFDNNLGACNWPSQGPACLENTLLPSD